MTNLQDKIWYACYGSNMLEERFLCYIRGGQPKGANSNYTGCTDKTSPADSEDFYISSELYFARKAPNWNKHGVAFIRTRFDDNASTLARIYLINKGQLVEIAGQETNAKTELVIDFDKTIEDGSYIFKQPSYYGNILYLGKQNDYPIFTLTNEHDLQEPNKPSHDYLRIIIQGIRETHDYDDKAIFDYLRVKKGIAGNYGDEELANLFKG